MTDTITAAFPFVEVKIVTDQLTPIARRAPGVLAIVGVTDKGLAPKNTPVTVDDLDHAVELFASTDSKGRIVTTPLYRAVEAAMLQDPGPSKFYGVRVDTDGHTAGLAALGGVDDVTFVTLAETTDIGKPNPPEGLHALRQHVDNISKDGNRRVGVAMVDPTRNKGTDYLTKVAADYNPLRSELSRLVLVAARGATGDAASASAAAIAGFDPGTSIVLKKVRGLSIPPESQYEPGEIKALSELGIVPIIDEKLIPGPSLHFADGRCFTKDESVLWCDLRLLLDDLESRLKAGLIGLIGDVRITRAGLTALKARIEGILGPLKRSQAIDDFLYQNPVHDILLRPQSTWTPTDTSLVEDARRNRALEVYLLIKLGPAIHRLRVVVTPSYS